MEALLIIMIITASISFVASIIISAITLATASGVKKYPNPASCKSTAGLKVTSLIFFILNTLLFIGFVIFLIAFCVEMSRYSYSYYYIDSSLASAGCGLLIVYTVITFVASLLTLLAFISANKAVTLCMRMGVAPVIAQQYVYQQQPMYQQVPPQQYAQPAQPVQQTAQNKFCSSCGTANLPEAKFCTKCGNTL